MQTVYAAFTDMHKPAISAEGAILMDAGTNTVLYSKNIHEHLYPASTTKLLTALVAFENSDLSDMVEFSNEAVSGIEPKSSNMGMDAGQSITMEQCLYGILVYSANEVCNAVAEHVAGSVPKFVDMMNAKAKELGCMDSHFVTANGLHDDDHYTSPYDLAVIAKAFFSNETLSKIAGTSHYTIEPTVSQPDLIDLYTHNKLTNNTYPYEGYIGGKTGYTSQAQQTLVSCAERNGMKLICVVMKEDSPMQFTDTVSLFDYGFDNFGRVNIAQNDKGYMLTDFNTDEEILYINKDDYVILPNAVSFSDLTSTLSYEDNASDPLTVASIKYSYSGIDVGHAKVRMNKGSSDISGLFDTSQIRFVNIKTAVFIMTGMVILSVLLTFVFSFMKNYHFHKKGRCRFHM